MHEYDDEDKADEAVAADAREQGMRKLRAAAGHGAVVMKANGRINKHPYGDLLMIIIDDDRE